MGGSSSAQARWRCPPHASRALPLQAAWKAVEYVKSGMVVGLGTGSTAAFAGVAAAAGGRAGEGGGGEGARSACDRAWARNVHVAGGAATRGTQP